MSFSRNDEWRKCWLCQSFARAGLGTCPQISTNRGLPRPVLVNATVRRMQFSPRQRTRQVARISNNLNQLARWANTYAPRFDAVETGPGTIKTVHEPHHITAASVAAVGSLTPRPPFSASNSRRTSSSDMSADQPYAAATVASRASCASASHFGRAL